MVNGLFIQRRAEDDLSFTEAVSAHIEKTDQKIKSVAVKIDHFEGSTASGDDAASTTLDDILMHSVYALNAFYQGHLDIDLTRGQKKRQIHVKTTLKNAIYLMKVFPYTEYQTFHVVSPRKILVLSKIQMEKIFYSDHYYVDLLWHFDEQLGQDGQVETTISLQCDLVFVKNVNMIKKKIQDYYDQNMLTSFNQYLKPQIELWI